MLNRIRNIIFLLFLCLTAHAQLNTDRITAIGRNALYFEDYVLSIQYFNQVIRVKPYLAEPYLYRAIAKIQLSDYTGAADDCQKAIENNPFMPGAYYTRGFVYRQIGQAEKAEADFTEALLFAPENKTFLLLRADVRAQQKKYDEAMADLDFLIKKDPKSASLYFEKGIIKLEQQDTLQAIECFKRTTELDSQNPSNWSALGHTYLMTGEDAEALVYFNKAISLGSKWAGDYVNRGIIFYKRHNYRGAIADYEKAVELSPKDPQCYYNRGLLREEVGDLNRALEDFDKVLELKPDQTEAHYQRALINMQLRQWEKALTDLGILIDQYPYFIPSYYLAAQAHQALSHTKEAFRYQQKAHDLESQKETIQQQRKLLTDPLLANAQPQKKDHRKEFSSRTAQNQTEVQESKYESESRGSVQNNHSDVINEPSVQLSYYSKEQTLRQTNYYHYAIQQFNQQHNLPAPLRLTTQEVALTVSLVNQHFQAIDQLSEKIDLIDLQHLGSKDSLRVANIFFQRAMEFALVQDYSSAIDDCTKAITLSADFAIAFFCRANWRTKQYEYQLANNDATQAINSEDELLEYKYGRNLILRDYDQVLRIYPDFAFAYYNKANILCEQKAFKDAIQCYDNAILIDPEFAEAWFNRGLTKIFISLTDDGIDDLSKAGELGIYQAYNLITRFRE